MFVLGKVLSTAAVLLCILCLAAPLKKTKAGQKIKGLRILLKPHVLYGWLLLVIGLMHGIMAGKNPGMISGKLVWMVLLVLLLAACLKSRMKCLDVSAQILICCFCSRNRISYCVCSDILKLQFLFPPCKSF